MGQFKTSLLVAGENTLAKRTTKRITGTFAGPGGGREQRGYRVTDDALIFRVDF